MKFVNPGIELIENLSLDKKIELCGRVCYKSEDKITEESSIKFINMIIKNGHESVLEHGYIGVELISNKFNINTYLAISNYFKYFNFSVKNDNLIMIGNIRAWRDLFKQFFIKKSYTMDEYMQKSYMFRPINAILFKFIQDNTINLFFQDFVEDYKDIMDHPHNVDILNRIIIDEKEMDIRTFRLIIDRAIANEIVRHRVFSFSQESTRYVNYKKNGEMEFIQPFSFSGRNIGLLTLSKRYLKDVEKLYNELIEDDIGPQFARNILPHCLKTELIMTGNISQWKEFIKLRTAVGAHPSVNYIAKLIEEKI
jgi:thymidylate synthase (FAD)